MIDLDVLEDYASTVRQSTQQLDFWRLLFVRSRRMLLLSTKLLEQFEIFCEWVRFLDKFLSVLALYQACVLIPRFMMNAFYVGRHIQEPTPHDMLVRCWEMAYDFGWIMNGILAAFILTGALAPLVVYLPVLTPSYQLCVHATRFFIEYCRFQALGNKYLNASDKKRHEIHAVLIALKQEASATLLPLVIRMGVSVCVISTAMVMLVGSANPVIPFLAAMLAVVATLAGKYLAQNMSKWPEALEHLNLMPFLMPESVPESVPDTALKQACTAAYAEQNMFRHRKHGKHGKHARMSEANIIHSVDLRDEMCSPSCPG